MSDIANGTVIEPKGDDLVRDLVTYLILGLHALVCVWLGAFRSVQLHQQQKTSSTPATDVLTSRDVAMFPLFASAALISAYFAFVVMPKEYASLVITAYFFFVGTMALYKLFQPILVYLPKSWGFHRYQLSLREFTGDDDPVGEAYEFTFDYRDLALIIVSAAISGFYAKTKHWILNNLIAFAFCVTTIPILQLNTFTNAVILLSGLFIYDIFWVFGTHVMISVAKNFDAPIKLLVPHNILTANAFTLKPNMGSSDYIRLGDIVVPGIYIALMLRFDNYLGKQKRYFLLSFISYFSALLATMNILHFFKKAQPALLYIVPLCLIPTCILALVERNWTRLLHYKDHENDMLSKPTEADEKKTD